VTRCLGFALFLRTTECFPHSIAYKDAFLLRPIDAQFGQMLSKLGVGAEQLRCRLRLMF